MVNNWPADHVERRPLSALLPYANNARQHSEAQVAQLAAAIQEWGWTMPVLVDETGMIIAGHGRVMAAKRLALEDVPVMTARGWSDAQKRAYVIADNRLTEASSWDKTLLAKELAALENTTFDSALTGFDEDQIKALTKSLASAPVQVQEILSSDVQDRFWISIRGPLKDQAAVLQRLRQAMEGLPAVSVEMGTVAVDP